MFNENSNIVNDYVILIRMGEKKIDEVPNFQNLKDVVTNVLEKFN